MATLPIPTFSQDRGPVKVDPVTGSTLQAIQSYCKDLNGCNDPSYRAMSQSASFNVLTGSCVKKFAAAVTVSIIIDRDYTTDENVLAIIDLIKNAFVAGGNPPVCGGLGGGI